MKLAPLFAGLLPMAAALPLAPAMAQSSVTIYGLLDNGIEVVNHTPTGTMVRESSSSLSGTHFGLRGTEDLGCGNKAIFVLESGFNIDNGTLAQGGRLFGRQAYVGLSGKYGTITLGRQQNLLDDVMIWYDPMRFGVAYSAVDHDTVMAGRADNAVKYVKTYAGLTVTGLYARGYDAAPTAAASPMTNADDTGSEMSLGIGYIQGPLSVGGAVDHRRGRTVSQSQDTQRRAAVGGRYSVGSADLYAGFRWLGTRTGSETSGSNLYWIGATYHLTPALQLTGTIYHTDARGSTADPTTYVVATEYFFSKRTEIFASAAYAQNHGGSNLGVGGFGVNIEPDTNQLGVVAGLRHRF